MVRQMHTILVLFPQRYINIVDFFYISSFSESARNLWGKLKTITVCNGCEESSSETQPFNMLPVATVSILCAYPYNPAYLC